MIYCCRSNLSASLSLSLAFTFCSRTRRLFRIMTILWKNVSSPPRWVNFFRLKRTVRRLHNQRPVLKPGFSGRHNHSESIRAASSDFEARRLLRQSARHRRERAPGTGPMLVPSLQRYQACPLSKPRIDLCTPDFLSRSVRY